MRIAIDAMGGDNAPRDIVLGALDAAAKDHSVQIILVGDEAAIRQHLPATVPSSITLHPASQCVEMDESPSSALRNKKDSSVAVATRLLKEGKADACLSAGNTGAASTFALFILGRIEGIDRPGIATVFPTSANPIVMLDAGANVDCKPRHLADFAIMGAAYIPAIHDMIPGQKSQRNGQRPTVGLLSIGEEEAKGNELTKSAFALLSAGSENGIYKFFGNVEGRDMARGTVDVVVCDGFVGNVVLKLAEGYAVLFTSSLKEALLSTPLAKLGAFLAAPAIKKMKRRLDHTEWGGAVLLGVNGNCIICHGSASPRAISSAIRVGKLAVDNDVPGNIRAAVAHRGSVEPDTSTSN